MNTDDWQKIKEIFNAAIESPAAERAAMLESCAANLRGEVAKLLKAHAEADDFIVESAFVDVGLVDEAEADFYIGKQIDGYRILEEIGQGGMGAVYLAAHAEESFTQTVAVKLIKRGMDTAAVLKRFVMERQILANLEHANIARLLDVGTTTDGLPYFVMEYIEGLPVTKYCVAHEFSTAERLQLFRRICAAVHYAHQNLVVHRDLKPSNILVMKDGAPKLLDFGIAKLLNPDWSTDTAEATATMMRLLTPEYASPEQLRGGNITTASDVYSLGVVLYELLSGQRPFVIENDSREEFIQAILTKEPLRPSAVSNSRFQIPDSKSENQTLSNDDQNSTSKERIIHPKSKTQNPKSLKGDLDNIILKALSKDAARRYASVQEFSEDVRRHLEGLPVAATADTLSYRLSKFISRHQMGFAATILASLLLLAATTAAIWQAVRADAERARAEARFRDVRTLANSLMFEIHDSIKDLPGATPARKLLVGRALDYLDKLANESHNDMTLQSELAAGYEKIGDVQGSPLAANLGDSAGALASYRKALAIRETLAAAPGDFAERYTAAMLHSKIYRVMMLQNDFTEAEFHCRRAIKILDELVFVEPDNLLIQVTTARFYLELGELLVSKKDGDTEAALVNYRRSIAVAEAIPTAAELPEKAADGLSLNEKILSVTQMAYRRIGQNAETRHQTDEALGVYLKALAAAEKLAAAANNPPKPHSRIVLAIALGNVGRTQAATGKVDEALTNTQAMLEICEKAVADDPQNYLAASQLAVAHGSLGDVYFRRGDFEKSLAHFQISLELQEKMREKSPDDVYNIGNLGETLAAIGDVHEKTAARQTSSKTSVKDNLREARTWHQRSLDIWLNLRNKDRLPAYFVGKIEEQNQAVSRCGAVLN